MLEKDLVYELFKDKDKVCESYIWCAFLEKLNSLNKDSHGHKCDQLGPINIVYLKSPNEKTNSFCLHKTGF